MECVHLRCKKQEGMYVFRESKRANIQTGWHMSVIPAFGRWRLEDHEASLGYIARPCLKKKK
jgi:hypothetical protein